MEWPEYLQLLSATDELLPLLANPADEALRQEAYRLFFLSISSGFFSTFADPDRPDFVPAVNTHFNASSANPDFVYYQATIDGTGVYRIAGTRGDGLFVLLDISAGGLGVMDELGPSLGLIDFDTLTLNASGAFELLLSAEKPANWHGDWRQIDPRARTLVLRQASYDWGVGRDGRFAIERMDKPLAPLRLDAAETARRLERLAGYPKRYAGLWLRHMAGQREKKLVNSFEHDDWAGRGGVAGQHYYQGLFKLEPGHVLVLETALPERVRYWNVQLGDPLWNAIDWLNRQGSLNGGQARLDSDGSFRAVIALEDPGVPNWLDPGGWSEGSVMLRWTEASSGPAPVLTPVPLADLRAALPPQTPVVTPEERQVALRQRRRGVQLRRRW
ncbi:hypothetical protein GCM10010909_31020 [Acidocella aquatica]|uniref:DUF1214 domain-containing protein n=1 Tax=Acidocella aquatica TaxID=1922313 RepID=A0ABQ6A7L4_9PROT|nr:hypothetical protein [Acidocella aquatica]GLR68421.1 hypothetical protein GCM10010909_31020 [Acidocella aquatica]